MSQSLRITVGTVMLVPVVAAFVLTGFPAEAATQDKTDLRDPRINIRIDEHVKQGCRSERPGSVEHSICLAEGRKEAWRDAADARRPERNPPTLSLR